jgi:hypothetical protein
MVMYRLAIRSKVRHLLAAAGSVQRRVLYAGPIPFRYIRRWYRDGFFYDNLQVR